jgi:membrane glycosyltransferase
MSTFLRAIEFLCLGLWLGSDVFLSFVVAPGAFRLLGSRDAAGTLVGFALGRMHLLGVICGVVLLLARLARTRTFASFVAPLVLCVVLMIALTVVSQVGVSPRMAMLRVQMGSIQATPEESPLLVEFARLHRISVTLESGVLLAGFAALWFMVRELGQKARMG